MMWLKLGKIQYIIWVKSNTHSVRLRSPDLSVEQVLSSLHFTSRLFGYLQTFLRVLVLLTSENIHVILL